ncbi:complement factor H-like isoform X2 [Betta splendens]|uniref:Complement factor H-like isoform X2 n=1 Tax=Betta splendens TaxID=158456 RepID=A0A9W2XD01_BETSP|nr:complement factor H-like isoform X2 [Betta splendens]
MHLRHPALVLLLWFPAVLLIPAPTAKQDCLPPRLDNVGFVLIPKDKYNHNQTISYSCDNGLKPAAEGWWAQITCLNGKWSPEPQCIDENSCVKPEDVPNTRYSSNTTGWYENEKKIQVKCNKGYGTKNNLLTGTCINGTWSSMPVCEKSADSCSEPPQLPHAVIINQKYQEVFAVDSEVMYQCEDGYTTEQGESMKSVICISGNWTEGPTCRSSSSSGSSVSTVPTVPISNCGRHPIVINAVVVQSDLMSLKYRCNTFYSLEGPEIVKCYSNGMWSENPTCKGKNSCLLCFKH